MGAELLHADGRTEMAKLIIAFHNFANAPKKSDFPPPPSLFVFLKRKFEVVSINV
jgi:hypothetical protein